MRKLVGCIAAIMCVMMIWSMMPVWAEPSGSYTAKVLNGPLDVRRDADAKSKIVGSVDKGDTVSVLDEAFGWSKINKDKVTGWVAGYYLKKSGSADSSSSSSSAASGTVNTTAAVASGSSGKVTADSLRIRSGASTKHSVIGGLSKGETVKIISSKDGWLQIEMDGGKKGWVSGEFIAIGGKTVTPTKTAQSGKSTTKSGKGLKNRVIVVDPGHGGNDPGVIGTKLGTEEKTLNLSTSQYLAEELKSRGATVVMTRTKDEKPSLSGRVQTSQSAGADLFISVHYNSSKKKTSGTLTFYYSEHKDLPVARAISKQLNATETKLKDNGVSFGDLHVLRENSVPAALVEMGFLSNEKDERIVITDAYQRKAAAAVARGIENYFSN